MSESAQTRLEWIVIGQKQVKQMAEALARLATAQKRLNTSIKKQVSQATIAEKTASATARTATNTRVLVTLMKQQLILTKKIAGGTKIVGVQTDRTKAKAQGLLLAWKSIRRLIIGSLMSRGIGRLLREFRQAADEAMEFQIRISELRTISQHTQLTFVQWSDAVRKLSDEFNRAPLDVAEGLYQTLSNQIAEGAQAVQFMNEALRLSLITVSSTAEAVQGLTAVMNSYSYSVGDARYISDIFFKTVELGRLRMGEMANSIGRVTVLGSQLGVTYEEISASLAALTIQGVRFNKAQTWLVMLMLKLIRPTDKMKELLAEWGVVSGQAAIATWGWVGVLRKLEEAVKGGKGELTELAALFTRVRATIGAAGLIGNIETLEEALVEMADASKAAAKAFEIMRESAGFELQRELQRIKNFFVLELGQDILNNIRMISDSLGVTLSDAVKTVTKVIIKLGAALSLVFASIAVVAIGKAIVSLVLYTGSVGLAATATAVLTAQVTILGVSISGLTLGIGTAVAAIAWFGYQTYKIFQDAKKPISEFTNHMRTEMFEAAAVIKAEENRINADRVRAMSVTARLTKQIYLSAIAEQIAALNRLKQIEQDRVNFDNLLFEMKMKTAKTAEKEALIYMRLKKLRQDLSFSLAQEIRDWKEINAIQSDIVSTYGMASQFQDTYFRQMKKFGRSVDESGRKQIVHVQQIVKGSERIKQLMRSITKDVKQTTESHAMFSKVTKEQVQGLEETIEKERKRADVLTAIDARQNAIKETLEATTSAEGDLVAGMEDWLAKFLEAEKAAAKSAVLKGAGVQFIFDKKGWEKYTIALKEFAEIVAQIKETIATAKTQGMTLSPEQVTAFKDQLTALEGAYSGIFEKNIPIEGMDNFLSKFKEYANTLDTVIQSKTSLEFKLKVTEQALTNGAFAALLLKNEMIELGKTGYDSVESIQKASDQATGSLNRMLIWLNMALTVTEMHNEELNRAIKNTARLNSMRGQGMWAGGMVKRFAEGGSVGSDSIHAMLRPGEFVMNRNAARKNFAQLAAWNSGAARFDSGGEVVNNNVGDINITVQGGETSELTVRRIGNSLRREIRRGTLRLN